MVSHGFPPARRRRPRAGPAPLHRHRGSGRGEARGLQEGLRQAVLQGKAQCVAVAKLVPKGAAAPSAYVRWVRIALDRELGKALEPRFVKPRSAARSRSRPSPCWRRPRPQLALAGEPRPAVHIENLRATRSPLAVTTTARPVTTTTSANGASVSGSISSTDSATGPRDARPHRPRTAVIPPRARDVQRAGARHRHEVGQRQVVPHRDPIPMNSKDELTESCPSADGVVRRKGSLKFQRSTRETKTMIGLDYINETINVNATTSFTGKVDADANLSVDRVRREGQHGARLRRQRAARARPQRRADAFVVASSGTLNPATGAVATGQRVDRRRPPGTGLSRADAADGVREGHRRRRTCGQAGGARRDVHQVAYEGLKDAETHWQTPNACAKLDSRRPPRRWPRTRRRPWTGARRAARRAGRRQVDGQGRRPRLRHDAARHVDQDGADRPDDARRERRRRQPCGRRDAAGDVARRRRRGAVGRRRGGQHAVLPRARGERHADRRRHAGDDGRLHVRRTVARPLDVHVRATTGPPDGTVEIEPQFNFIEGSVRASGVSVAPAIIQTITCPPNGPTTAPRMAITYTGKFGPAISFGAVAGDPTKVTVFWGC